MRMYHKERAWFRYSLKKRLRLAVNGRVIKIRSLLQQRPLDHPNPGEAARATNRPKAQVTRRGGSDPRQTALVTTPSTRLELSTTQKQCQGIYQKEHTVGVVVRHGSLGTLARLEFSHQKAPQFTFVNVAKNMPCVMCAGRTRRRHNGPTIRFGISTVDCS